jgi:hypothetical protein
MAYPQTEDGGKCLQVWRVAVTILNKQMYKLTRGSSPDYWLGRELIIPHHKKTCYKMLHRENNL